MELYGVYRVYGVIRVQIELYGVYLYLVYRLIRNITYRVIRSTASI